MDNKKSMENYLLILKSTVEVYVHGTLESSNEDIRNILKDGLDEILNSQANTYDLMVSNGWYNVNNVESNVVEQTLNKVNNN